MLMRAQGSQEEIVVSLGVWMLLGLVEELR
jgi:hypothetical protein